MGSVYEENGAWYVRWKDGLGRRKARKTQAVNKTEARRLLAELERQAERQELGLEPLPSSASPSLAELARWWLDKRCREASLRADEPRLKKHIINARIGELRGNQITTARLEEHLREMLEAGAAPASCNKLRAVLRTIFHRSARAGLWIGPNPAAEVETHRVPKRVYETLSAEEVPVLLPWVDEEWRDVVAAAIFTALRKGELFGLEKRDVDLVHRTITVRRSYDRDTTKGSHADVIPIAQQLRPFLEHALKASTCNLVFPGPGGKMRDEEADPQKALRTALGRAGIVVRYDHSCRRCKRKGTPHVESHQDKERRRCPRPGCGMILWCKAIPRPVRFHDLRHTTATLLLRAGEPAQHVQRILRHASLTTTTKTYGHLVCEDLRPALQSLPELPAQMEQLAVGAEKAAPNGSSLPVESGPATTEGRTQSENPSEIRPSAEWALQVSNLRPLPCEGSALPLS